MLDKEDPAAIVHGEPGTTWLTSALLVALKELHDEGFDVKELPVDSLATAQDDGIRTVVALHSVHHHGTSLTALAEAGAQWAKSARAKALAVVATGRPNVAPAIHVAGKEVHVEHLISMRQATVRPDALSPDPAYYASTDGSERFLAMTSSDFWMLAQEAGFIPERQPPGHRDPLARVPDLLSFVDGNAAWMASKIQAVISYVADRSARDVRLALVRDEAAATKLGDILEDTLGNGPLRIPREAINAWKRNPEQGTEDEWRQDQEEWLDEVDAAVGAGREVVIIDEFAFSGGTLASMASLMTHLGFDVRLVMTIAAFSRERFETALDGFETFALYTTEWNSPATTAGVFDRRARS